MYICICNAIREAELRRVARRCPGDAEACYSAIGKQPSCGTCLDKADDIVLEEREAAFETLSAA
jgi:bacterioferritin-associated ferredoxin